MRRGFKTEAASIAHEVRTELGLSPLDPLDPWLLAEHLAIPVWKLSDYTVRAASVVQILAADQGAFSAMIAFLGLRRVIVHNDLHALTRQRADIAHELAHALLMHRPHSPRPGQEPVFDHEQEDEAAWFGGVLLVSEEACLWVCRSGIDLTEAAARFGVSDDLMRWRINASGARKRVERSTRARS